MSQPHPPGAAAPACPLAELNAYIRAARARRAPPAPPGEPAPCDDELSSVRRFRQAWARHRAQEQLQGALAKAPPNAGPLNSHALVLRSLALMQELSPDYLRRFLGHAESLLWLEQARAQFPRERAGLTKPAKVSAAARSRRK